MEEKYNMKAQRGKIDEGNEGCKIKKHRMEN